MEAGTPLQRAATVGHGADRSGVESLCYDAFAVTRTGAAGAPTFDPASAWGWSDGSVGIGRGELMVSGTVEPIGRLKVEARPALGPLLAPGSCGVVDEAGAAPVDPRPGGFSRK
jgi:hypothetical protein